MEDNNKKTKIKVVIKKEVTRMIEYFCMRMSTLEWSGTVFYKMKGSIRRPHKCTISVEGLYLQGIGSAAYTESDMQMDLFNYMEAKGFDVSHVRGIIHSHNNMEAYFSGTDVKELAENCKHNNIYLSIVVNNKLEAVAQIYQRKYVMKSWAFDEKGYKYEVDTNETHNIEYTKYDCDVEIQGKTVNPFPEFEDMIRKITEKKNATPTTRIGYSNVNCSQRGIKNNRTPYYNPQHHLFQNDEDDSPICDESYYQPF